MVICDGRAVPDSPVDPDVSSPTFAIFTVLVVNFFSVVLYYHYPFYWFFFNFQVLREVLSQYRFKYNVSDLQFGDVKSQSESSDGTRVTGTYRILQPDGKK